MTDKTGKFITASLMISLFGSGCEYAKIKPQAAAAQIVAKNEENTANKIYERKEWKEIVEKWDNMDRVKVKDFEEISRSIQKEQKSMSSLYDSLIKEGYLSKVSAEAINLIYGENLRRTLEGTVQLPTCYEPMMTYEWDCTGVDTREALNKKLYLVEDLYKKGTVKKDILDKAKKEIEERLTLLDKADKYWQSEGKGKSESHPKEVDVLLHLYDMNSGGIKEGKSVELELIKASEYIVELEKQEVK
jgi:hypothetical protein